MQLHKRQKLRQQCTETISSIRQRCLSRAASLRCPIHSRAAIIRVEGDKLEDLNIQIEGCCSAFVEKVRAAVNQDL